MARAAKYPELLDADWLKARYVHDGLSLDQIAEILGFDCTYTTVRYWMVKHGISRRPASAPSPSDRRLQRESV